MKSDSARDRGRDSLELVEEAIHLLRTATPAGWAAYYAGSFPFVLGLLLFWSDMSRSPLAGQHLPGAALALGLLSLWMKYWQALFVRHFREAIICGHSIPFKFGHSGRLAIIQSTIQPTGLFLIPLSLILVLPFPWIYGFYQTLTALGESPSGSLRETIRKAWLQAGLWPRQLLLLSFFMTGFSFFVLLNWSMICYMTPGLIKTLLGTETIYARSGTNMLNTTFFAIMFGLTYLCVDPILKIIFLLRCFYGESLRTGEDLKAELRSIKFEPGKIAAMILVMLTVGFVPRAMQAAETGSASTRQPESRNAVSPEELDKSIGKVVTQAKFAWRTPRDYLIEDESSRKGPIGKFIERAKNWIKHGLVSIWEWFQEWLKKYARQRTKDGDRSGGYGWIMWLQVLLYVLLIVVVVTAIPLFYRIMKGRTRRQQPLAAQPIKTTPDLSDESVGADQLEEDGWIKLGRELLGRGELRLAMRAFYFSSLSHLAARNLITMAKFKSNRDYERELGRRAHAIPQLPGLFGENVSAFDRTWYGLHEINSELIEQFAANVERINSTC